MSMTRSNFGQRNKSLMITSPSIESYNSITMGLSAMGSHININNMLTKNLEQRKLQSS